MDEQAQYEQTQECQKDDILEVSVSQDSSLTSPVSEEIEEKECQHLELTVPKDLLNQFVKELRALVDETKLVFNVIDGLRARVVDPAHVAMTETYIAREMFESVWYDSQAKIGTNGDLLELGIDMDKLALFLKTEKTKDAILELTIDLEDRRTLTITGPMGTRVMSLIDTTGMSDPKEPDFKDALHLKVCIEDPKLFRQQLKAMESVSDHVAIRYEHEARKLYLECVGDMDKVQCEVPKTVERGDRDARSLFPLEYLQEIAKVLPGRFSLEIGTDYPLRISYGKTIFLLAPRIESGD